MRVYLAGTYSRPFLYENLLSGGGGVHGWGQTVYSHFLAGESYKKEIMKIYLAGEHSVKNGNQINYIDVFILESFFYVAENKWFPIVLKNAKEILLDSGAFTFMQNVKTKLNWDEYVQRYAAFINEHKIDLFFELDIDSIVGIKEVERLREKLEGLTGKKCIPVWHKSRGKQYWLDMCKNYDYVSIGGIVSGEIKRNEYPFFNPLLKMAKERGAKVHGLGFTNLKGLTKYPFYSVDSTAWIYGNRGGFLYKFNGKTIEKIDKPQGTRLNSKQVAIHNFAEWVKFQKYAEINL